MMLRGLYPYGGALTRPVTILYAKPLDFDGMSMGTFTARSALNSKRMPVLSSSYPAGHRYKVGMGANAQKNYAAIRRKKEFHLYFRKGGVYNKLTFP